MKFSPFIKQMLAERCGKEIKHSADCEIVALDISKVTGDNIGVNTLKRLLGFIPDERQPRTSTLDIIARYLGFDKWEELKAHDSTFSNSFFNNSSDELLVSDLEQGTKVVVRYLPNRELRLDYLGENRFRVANSINSKLKTGDELLLTHLVKRFPMLVSEVVREGKIIGAFTAGEAEGIDFEVVAQTAEIP